MVNQTTNEGEVYGPHQFEAKEFAAKKLAAALHEQWRESRLREDGYYEPRIKSTEDEAWIALHGASRVDIANTSFEDLPADWQKENLAAAEVVVNTIDFCHENGIEIDLLNEESRNMVGEIIHAAWLSRHAEEDWVGEQGLDKPFTHLPEDEQAKDIRQMATGLEALGLDRPAISLRDEDTWRESKKINLDTKYGRKILKYVRDVAKRAEEYIGQNQSVEQAIKAAVSDEDLSKGITGFQFNCAIGLLVKIWSHGEALADWAEEQPLLPDDYTRLKEQV